MDVEPPFTADHGCYCAWVESSRRHQAPFEVPAGLPEPTTSLVVQVFPLVSYASEVGELVDIRLVDACAVSLHEARVNHADLVRTLFMGDLRNCFGDIEMHSVTMDARVVSQGSIIGHGASGTLADKVLHIFPVTDTAVRTDMIDVLYVNPDGTVHHYEQSGREPILEVLFKHKLRLKFADCVIHAFTRENWNRRKLGPTW